MTTERPDAFLRSRGAFLAEYAAWLIGCGATCIRVDKNCRRMAASWGLGVDLTVMPAHINVSVWGADPVDAVVVVRRAVACGISFNINAKLSRLSWEVADDGLGFDETRARFDDIVKTRPTDAREVLLLASLANASFCRLFGGDLAAMIIVFVSTLAGYRLKQVMLRAGRDVRITFLCASFFSASLSAAGYVFGLGATPDIAVGTSVLYLIPGVPYINSVSDMLDRHYLSAFSRLIDALVLTVCLSVGLCAGLLILGLKTY